MIPDNLEVWQVGAENRVVEKLPDGSTVVFDSLTKTVHSINQTAAAAFGACGNRQTVAQLATAMQEILELPVTEETALAAVYELEGAGLVACSGSRPPERREASRRSMLRTVGSAAAMAAPLVLSLTSAEQRAYATIAISGPVPSINADDSNNVCTTASGPYTITIAGVNTHFSGSSIVTFPDASSWLSVAGAGVTVNSAILLHVSVTVGAGAPLSTGFFSVQVQTGSEIVTGTGLWRYSDLC